MKKEPARIIGLVSALAVALLNAAQGKTSVRDWIIASIPALAGELIRRFVTPA